MDYLEKEFDNLFNFLIGSNCTYKFIYFSILHIDIIFKTSKKKSKLQINTKIVDTTQVSKKFSQEKI